MDSGPADPGASAGRADVLQTALKQQYRYVLLFRHGKTDSKPGKESNRHLSEEGADQVRQLSRRLAEQMSHGRDAASIAHVPLLLARTDKRPVTVLSEDPEVRGHQEPRPLHNRS